MWFGFWTQEAIDDPKELIASGGILSDLVDANDAARLSNQNLRAAVAKYRAALLAERQDAVALAQAICAGDTDKKNDLRARLIADVHSDLQAQATLANICNH